MKWLLIVSLSLSLAPAAYAQLAPPNDAGVSMGHVHMNVANVEVQKKLLILLSQQTPSGGSQGTVLDHFGLKVRNLHYILGDHVKLRDWYAETFSLVSRKRGEHDTADVPGMNLTFSTSKTPPTLGTKGRAVDHVGFEVRNLEAFCKKLEARGVKLDVPYRKIPGRGLAVAFLTDPFGVSIELTEGLDKF